MNIEELDCYDVCKEDIYDLKNLLSRLVNFKTPDENKIKSLENINEDLTYKVKSLEEQITLYNRLIYNTCSYLDAFLELYQKEDFKANNLEVIKLLGKIDEQKEKFKETMRNYLLYGNGFMGATITSQY